jgi:xylulokinase
VLGIAIEMPRVTDASFGAALIAGVGIGMHASEVEAARASVEVVARHEPDAALRGRYETMYGIYRDSARATADINHRLAAVERG